MLSSFWFFPAKFITKYEPKVIYRRVFLGFSTLDTKVKYFMQVLHVSSIALETVFRYFMKYSEKIFSQYILYLKTQIFNSSQLQKKTKKKQALYYFLK